MAEAVARFDRALADIIAAHGGVRPVEQGEGDSLVVAFDRGSDAVACALDLQLAPLAPIRIRIGLHTGEVQLRDEGNYFGPTINRTARLRDLAHGGQTVLSGATEEIVADHLPSGAWLLPLGSHQLRDLRRPETGNPAVPSRPPQRVSTPASARTRCLTGTSTSADELRRASGANRGSHAHTLRESARHADRLRRFG